MKKLLINTALIMIFIFFYFLQSNFFTWFNLGGILPNIFIILMVFIGIFMGKVYGITYGVIFGLCLDVFMGRKLGVGAIMYAVIGFIAAEFERNFSKDNRITVMIVIALCTACYEIGSCLLSYIMIDINIEIIEFAKILIVEIFFNVILGIILYPIMQYTGYDIEEEIKGSKILTKYF